MSVENPYGTFFSSSWRLHGGRPAPGKETMNQWEQVDIDVATRSVCENKEPEVELQGLALRSTAEHRWRTKAAGSAILLSVWRGKQWEKYWQIFLVCSTDWKQGLYVSSRLSLYFPTFSHYFFLYTLFNGPINIRLGYFKFYDTELGIAKKIFSVENSCVVLFCGCFYVNVVLCRKASFYLVFTRIKV